MSNNIKKFFNAKKIVVIGNAGGGKSTLSRKLSEKLSIPLYPIDHIQWQPGWVQTPIEEYSKKYTAILAADKWIIDGFGPWDFIEERLHKSDLVIYVDLPIRRHIYWATKRQLKCLFKPRIDGPPGCPMLPVTFKLYKIIWRIHKKLRPQLLRLIDKLPRKKVIHLKTVKELKDLFRKLNHGIKND